MGALRARLRTRQANDRKLQLTVLRQTFALLDEPMPDPVIKDYVAEKIPIGMHMG